MLQKQNRVRKQKEFDRVFKAHKKIKSDNFQILIHFTNLPQPPRFGFIVTKKVGKAVMRNKVKRRLREIIRAELPNLKTGFEAVLIAFPQIVDLDFKTLQSEVIAVLKVANILKLN